MTLSPPTAGEHSTRSGCISKSPQGRAQAHVASPAPEHVGVQSIRPAPLLLDVDAVAVVPDATLPTPPTPLAWPPAPLPELGAGSPGSTMSTLGAHPKRPTRIAAQTRRDMLGSVARRADAHHQRFAEHRTARRCLFPP